MQETFQIKAFVKGIVENIQDSMISGLDLNKCLLESPTKRKMRIHNTI